MKAVPKLMAPFGARKLMGPVLFTEARLMLLLVVMAVEKPARAKVPPKLLDNKAGGD
jgi:hypothetical protein